jgi:PAS domain S-box-containing protein
MSRSPRSAVAKTATRPPSPSYAELEARVAELSAELREAREQQTATAEVLQVINSSPGDLAPVFDAMLEKALRLCSATHGHIWRVEGQHAHAVALHGDAQFIESMRGESPTSLLSDRPLGRIARGEHVVRLPDATKEEIYRTNPAYRKFIDASGIRSGVMVALRKAEALLGAIVVHRKEVLPFTDKQIALLQNFAAQAVIAMENARLIGELSQRTEELTRREGALRDSEARYALAMRAINEGVYEEDVDTGEMYYSPRVRELVGLQVSDLRTMKDWIDRIHPDDRGGLRKAVIAHYKGETDRLAHEYRYRHADGTWHWALTHGIALKNQAGRVYPDRPHD